MAEIYRAKTFDAQGHAHLVAVKRVLAHLAEDDDFIQMLVDEAKIAGQLRHGNIARVYEFARAHGEYFIAMEHVDGKDLRTILERCRQKKRPVPPQHAAHIAAEVANALHAAHVAVDSRNRPLRIVHRDVSPSNVIVSYTGEVKLCDFGIAKATLSQVNTKTGVIKGKVKYMSPEQALGRKLDHRSDIFSLGACLYEMLTRVPPFTATNEMDLLIKVRDAKYRAVSEIVPNIPPEIESIADRCLARSRAHRYQTAQDSGETLRGFLKRYMPGYSRSHLGRYVRKMFAQEIERELRMLEEYVLSEDVDDDVGENLIQDVLGPGAEFVGFSPKPSGDTATRVPTSETDVETPPRPGLFDTMSTDVSSGVATGVNELSNKHRGPTKRMEGVAADKSSEESTVEGLNIHDAKTLILDAERPALKKQSHQETIPVASSKLPPNFDPSVHNAPTLILDRRRKRRRKG